MKRFLLIIALVLMILGPEQKALAQGDITIVDGSVPISSDLRAELLAYLEATPPASVPYYGVTYIQAAQDSTYISLAALDLSSANEPWSMETHDGDKRQAVWAGTIQLFFTGGGQLIGDMPQGHAHLALGLPSAGGGSYVAFPFQAGSSMMYGPRGIHGSGDYGTSGMNAVDLVGGTNLGSNVAPPIVYASDAGTIDYVCNDNTSVAVRTHNDSTGDYFVYAHLLNNANLEIGHTFARGSAIGSLKYGTFNDDCGWADQSNTTYHVHWMFKPANNAFQAENCTLKFSDQKWYCGDKVVGINGWLTAMGGGSGSDDPNAVGGHYSFWDGVVNAVVTVAGVILGLLPEHNSPTLLLKVLFNAISLAFRLTYVFIRGNFNLTSMVIIVGFALAFRLVMGIIWIFVWALRVISFILRG